MGRRKKIPALKVEEAEEILNQIFEDCDEEPNTIPMNELVSYSLYRKESFRVQMGVLFAALILFIFLPALFVQPSFVTSYSPKGERGLPVYTVNVNTIFPVKCVTAVLGNYRLPVYEVNGHKYTIEPTKNGSVEVTVELFNGQYVTKKLDVKNVDVASPILVNHVFQDGRYELYLTDDGVGVDFEGIYATTDTGEIIRPESYDRQSGRVIFGEEVSGALVCIPDYYENVLKLILY